MTTDGGSLLEGVYESLITAHLQKRLDEAGDIDAPRAAVADADEPEVLSRHVAQAVARVLRSERNPELRVDLVNRVLKVLGSDEDAVVDASRQLLAVSYAGDHGTRRPTLRPATPLSDAALLTNASGEPGIGHELRAEIPTADRVDVIMAFVKWHGIRVIETQLR